MSASNGDFTRATFAAIDDAAAARALGEVYEGYLIPLAFTPAGTARQFLTMSLARGASPIWYDGERLVAAALIGSRGTRGWLGAFGVSTSYRGRGIGRAFLRDVVAAASRLGAHDLRLEVFEANAPALATYANAGFTQTRRLISWCGTLEPGASRTDVLEAAEIAALLRREPADRPCWQLEPESLRNTANLEGVRAEGGVAIFRRDVGVARAVRCEVEDARDLAAVGVALHGAFGLRSMTLTNEPEGTRADRAARDLGWQRTIVQHEMTLAL